MQLYIRMCTSWSVNYNYKASSYNSHTYTLYISIRKWSIQQKFYVIYNFYLLFKLSKYLVLDLNTNHQAKLTYSRLALSRLRASCTRQNTAELNFFCLAQLWLGKVNSDVQGSKSLLSSRSTNKIQFKPQITINSINFLLKFKNLQNMFLLISFI